MGYKSTEVLNVTESASNKEWILDNEFRRTLSKSWFESYIAKEWGFVLLGNNKACRVIGIGTVKLRMFDGSENIVRCEACT